MEGTPGGHLTKSFKQGSSRATCLSELIVLLKDASDEYIYKIQNKIYQATFVIQPIFRVVRHKVLQPCIKTW